RRHTRFSRDWSSDVCSSDLGGKLTHVRKARELGLDVVYAQFPDEYDRGHQPYVDQALLLDYGDIDRLVPLVQALHEVYPFQAARSEERRGGREERISGLAAT